MNTKRLLTALVLLTTLLVSCKKTKEEVPVTGITLSKTTLELNVGEDTYLTATVKPDDATDKTVVWSCTPESVISVDQTGQVVGMAPGEGTVTVTSKDGKVKATCKVTVKEAVVKVQSVSLSAETLTMEIGDDVYLTATVKPDNATNKEVTWSGTPESVIKVYQTGQVVAMGAGEGTVTVTTSDDGFKASCKVTVNQGTVHPESIVLNPETLELEVGQTATIGATVLPEDTTDKSLSWKSSYEAVATVDQEGKITALMAGEAIITAIANARTGVQAYAHITVKDVQVESVTVSPALVSLSEGETCQLTASVLPANARQDVEWASQNKEVATVDENGLVTAVRVGTTRIYARSKPFPEVQGWCEVTVNEDDSVKGIALSSDVMTIKVGESQPLTVSFTPTYAANKNVSWASDNPSVASVSDEGVVMGLAEGKATVTATSEDGGHTASCAVTVTAANVAMVYYWTDGGMHVNGVLDPRNTLYDKDGFERYDNYLLGTDVSGKTLYSLEPFTGSFYASDIYLCKDREPLFSLPHTNSDEYRSLSVQKDFFAYLAAESGAYASVWKGDYDGNMVEIPIEGTFTKIYASQMATHPDGRILVTARIRDSFGDSYQVLYTISPDNTVIEERLSKTYCDAPAVTVSEEGDIYLYGCKESSDNNYKYQAFLFKNGEEFDGYEQFNSDYGAVAITCQGGHVYTALDNNQDEIRIRKDGNLLYTIKARGIIDSVGEEPLIVTPSGDVYLSVSEGGEVYSVYKDGERLYTIDHKYYSRRPFAHYCVIE